MPFFKEWVCRVYVERLAGFGVEPLAATVYPLTTRRHCTCHIRKHRAETHRVTPASALVLSKLRHGRFTRYRVGCAALHSLSPPSFHLHLCFHSGAPRQVHCPVLRRKVITSVWNVKGRCALRVPPFFATLQNGYHPCLNSPPGGTLGAV